jgi:hypothetical protein
MVEPMLHCDHECFPLKEDTLAPTDLHGLMTPKKEVPKASSQRKCCTPLICLLLGSAGSSRD